MKICVTTSGTALDAPVDPRFGRAARFLLYDDQDQSWEVLDNEQNLNAEQGAGIQSACTVAAAGAQVLITGHCGPKAYKTLAAAKIQVVHGATGTVRQALADFAAGKLKVAAGADVEGHWA